LLFKKRKRKTALMSVITHFVSATIGLPRECPTLLVVLRVILSSGMAFMAGDCF